MNMTENIGKTYPEDRDCKICPEEMLHFSELVDELTEEGKIKIPHVFKLYMIINSIQFFLIKK